MVLKNDFLKITIDALGAELKSILTKNDVEILWQANPDFWAKTSPILFPIVGGLKDNCYYFDNEKHHLNRHGFAREMMFEEEQISDEKIIFTLANSSETKKNYPFEFILRVIYTLQENKLLCTYEVENPSQNNLYFSIGAHPAFALGNTKEDFEAYELQFNNDTELICNELNNGLISEKTKTISLETNTLQLKYDLFYNDALVLQTLKSNEIILYNKSNSSKITFSFNDFPYFGIWSAPNANFICLEPWCGVADDINSNQNFTQKEGIICLPTKEQFSRSWSVLIEQ
ncbi:aldose 1-epimerase family protein [Flavobacterium sp. xlx-214]|uniref:aldose 1-epimerase family protein n=1 Tax=unclassified Flavobacterium TaxID=196869 RepID=UPI0013CFF286|nr:MULTISPECIES: aldose 1-epimerase family protein [unclassified Flavobacterium]MBA5791206.1 aldose 1-epimerase family protein [Flavobacterium sp. xlx-221]QMI83625.1 aldose 1-epimerase family protein [Flavobacterium sp. xlx-214]